MPKYRNRSARIIFFNTSDYLGLAKYREGSIAGKQLTFSGPSNDDDTFEELMVEQANVFNEIQSGEDLNSFDFTSLITLINGLDPKFNSMKNFLIDTLTVVELARTSYNDGVNVKQQLEILQGEYDKAFNILELEMVI